MSLRPHTLEPVPEETARVAHAAFPKGNPYLLLRDTLGTIFQDAVATVAPAWLQGFAPLAWYERYGKRIEDTRLPQGQASRDAYAQMVGEDGFHFLDAMVAPDTPQEVRALPILESLRRTWQRHYERTVEEARAEGGSAKHRVRFKANRELPPAAESIASPYDADARYRHKRDTSWTGYMVHVSETCEPTAPHLLTHVHTTPATVHEAQCTTPIQQALKNKELAPREHFVDAAYISAELLVHSHDEHGITLRGPTRPRQGWQQQVAGAYTLEQFTVDWEQQQMYCPQGKRSGSWQEHVTPDGHPSILVSFRRQDCHACPTRPLCTQSRQHMRRLRLPPREQYEALATARTWYTSEEGIERYKQRAGVEGTLSQGVRAFGLRRTRYRGLPKTPMQHVAIAAAINIDRIVAWLDERPQATTRTSRFAALAPACALTPGKAAA
jgi:transposase